MTKKSVRPFLCIVLLCLTSPTEATLTFTEVWEYTTNAWGISTVAAITAAAILALKCACKCAIGCCRRRIIKKKLHAFNAQELLTGMARIAQEHLSKGTGEAVTIFEGALAKDPSWYIISGSTHTQRLASDIKRDGGINETVRGLIIIGASFGHPHLAPHSHHADTRTTDLKIISNCCIDHKIPLLIMYLGQDTHAKHLPSFKFTTLSIPVTHALFDGARTRSDEHTELTVENLLTHYGPAIEAKSSQFAEHKRGCVSYPQAARAKHEAHNFRRSLRNFIDEDAATIDVSQANETDTD